MYTALPVVIFISL